MLFANVDRVHLLGAVFSLIIIITVFWLVRARMIKEKYSLIWFLIGLFMLTMSVSKDLLENFSSLVGVYYPPSALFAIFIACAYMLLLNLSVTISGLKKHNKALTQELGLTNLRLEQLEKKVNNRES
mgnify:FL=1